jgi:6-pyruvoyltetrahydropterin/6-carboxytetrahydropterin synthase
MYRVAVKKEFIAQHYLIGGDWGAENDPHSHHYQLELILEGETLDPHGYLVDIVDIENALNAQVNRYQDRMLNDLPEFKGLNPSLECFARIISQSLADQILVPNLISSTVKLWENDNAWASYRAPVAHR